MAITKQTMGVIATGVVTLGASAVTMFKDGREVWKDMFGAKDTAKTEVVVPKTATALLPDKKPETPSSGTVAKPAAPALSKTMLKNPSPNRSGVQDVCVAIVADKKFDNLIGNQVANILRSKGYEANNYFFTQEAIDRDYVGKVYNMESRAINDLGLPNFADEAFIGFLTVESSAVDIEGNMIHNAVARFHSNWLNVKTQALLREISFDAKGVGFTEVEAKRKAQKALLEELKGRFE